MRTIAVATISFGLVEIPVRVYASVESKSKIEFRLLHAPCGARLKQKLQCSSCAKSLERDDAELVKGYEFAKNRFVTFRPDELKLIDQAESPENQRIEIVEFVGGGLKGLGLTLAHIDRCYFLGPDEGSERAYATLAAAMDRKNRFAIAKHTTRDRTRVVMLFAEQGRIELVQLHFAHEVRSLGSVELDTKATDADVELAMSLIDDLTPPRAFALERYEDEQQLRLAAQIQEKIEGRDIVAERLPFRATPIVDVVDALKASLKQPAKKRARRAEPATP